MQLRLPGYNLTGKQLFNGWWRPGSQQALSEVMEHRSDIKNILGKVHLEAWHKNFIAWFLQEISKQCVIKVIFISCLSRKANTSSQRKGEWLLFTKRFNVCAIWWRTSHVQLNSSSHSVVKPQEIQEVLTLQPHRLNIWTIITSCLSRTEAGWELGGEQDLLLHLSPRFQLFSTSWLHLGSDSPY